MSIPLFVFLASLSSEAPAVESPQTPPPAWAALVPPAESPAAEPEPLGPPQAGPGYVDENAWYLRLSGGLVTTETSGGPPEEVDFDEGFLLALAIGHHFGAQERTFGFDVELEGQWTDQDTSGDVSSVRDYNSIGVLLNALVDVRIAERLFLYGGGGLGASFVDVGTSSDALEDFDEDEGPYLTWQAKAGLMYRFDRSIHAIFGYRFVNINDIEISDSIGTDNFDVSTQQHVLELGVGFGF